MRCVDFGGVYPRDVGPMGSQNRSDVLLFVFLASVGGRFAGIGFGAEIFGAEFGGTHHPVHGSGFLFDI